ncbi:hypothetical protein LguiA_015341 [Lonicera macranthoides]
MKISHLRTTSSLRQDSSSRNAELGFYGYYICPSSPNSAVSKIHLHLDYQSSTYPSLKHALAPYNPQTEPVLRM